MLLKALLFGQLLYVVNQVHFPFESPIPGLAITNLLFIAVLIAMRGQPEVVPGRGRLYRPIVIFLGALTFAFLWAQVRSSKDLLDDAIYLKNALFFPLYYFLYFKCRQDEKTTRLLIIWVLVIATVAGLEATLEGISFGFDSFNYTRRASGPFGVDWHNSNRAGVFFAMFMPMFVALVLFLKGKKLWRLGALGSCMLLSVGTLATYSRQAYLMVLLGWGLLLLRKSIVIAAIMAVVLISLASYLPDSVVQRAEETRQTGKHGEEEVDQSTQSRWEIWGGAVNMLAHNPIGVGLNRFKGELGNYSTYKNMDAHNFYVLTMAEAGLQGLIPLVLMFWAVIRLAGYVRANAPPDDVEMKALAIGFTICALMTALGGLYGSPTLEGSVMAPFWALCGLLERYVLLRSQRTGEAPVEPATRSLVERFPLAAYIRPGPRP